MAGRSWFFASQGQQQGPYPEAKLREFIANGTVTSETLVWTEGMAGWQKAGDIPGLLSAAPTTPAFPASEMPLSTAGATAAPSLSVDFSVWALLGRTLLFMIGFLLVIPAPWVATSFYRWMRWACRNVAGTRREIVFNANGWQVLWRTVVYVLAMALIIPIPWAMGWYARWYVSQFALLERTA